MASLNKVLLIGAYSSGQSLTDIARLAGTNYSATRKILLDSGVVFRSRVEGIRLARRKARGVSTGVIIPPERLAAMIAKSAATRATKAVGTGREPNGYIEYTTGPHKGRSVHRVAMEQSLGRPLLPSEIVHHRNGVRDDNRLENLEVMTRARHSHHHGLESHHARARDEAGRFAPGEITWPR